MGKNLKEYILEVNRCLVTSGTLIVAETSKSLKERFSILRDYLEERDFEIYLDEEKGDFIFIESRKV